MCRPTDPEQFRPREAAIDVAAAATPGIARFCSSSMWALAAHERLHRERSLELVRDGEALVAIARGPLFDLPHVWQSLEAAWGFACPLLGPDPIAAADLFADAFQRCLDQPPAFFLGGLRPDSPALLRLQQQLQPRHHLQLLEAHDCVRASLEDGYDGFLSRRSGEFRRQLKRIRCRLTEAGVRAEFIRLVPDPAALMARFVSIEERGWKHRQEQSPMTEPEHARFYADVLRRAAEQGRLGALVLSRDGVDLAYNFGAVFAGEFRGLQMAYDDNYRHLSLGHAAQLLLVEKMCHGKVDMYDFGMDIAYKRSWGEEILPLRVLFGHKK